MSVAVAAVLFIPFGLVVWRTLERPQMGVLFLAALAPFDGLLLIAPLPGFATYWTEALVLAIVGTSFVQPPSTENRSEVLRIPTWAVLAGGMIALALVWVVISPTSQSLTGFRISFFFLAVPLALWRHPLDRGERDRFVTVLMVTGTVVSVVGLLQQLLGEERLNAMGYEYNEVIRTTQGFLRSFSTFNQPFPFAFYVMIVLLVAVPVALGNTSRRRNRLFLMASPLLVAGMATAFVRGAFLGLAVGFVFLTIHRHRMLIHTVALALIVVILVPAGVGSAIVSSSSLGQRTSGWSDAADVVENPIGLGIGTVGAAAQKFEPDSDPLQVQSTPSERDSQAYQPDNYYMKVLLELGPIGLWLFAGILISAWQLARRLSGVPRRFDAALATGIAASILGAASAAMVASYPRSTDWLSVIGVSRARWLIGAGVVPGACRRVVKLA